MAARSIDQEVKRKGSTWLRVQREAVALPGMMPQRPSIFRPNCVNVWTPGQLNRATNRHAPKPSFGLSSWGLKPSIEGGSLANRAAKASELAAREIDRLIDPSSTDEERQLRKQRLIKGPKEFKDIRKRSREAQYTARN